MLQIKCPQLVLVGCLRISKFKGHQMTDERNTLIPWSFHAHSGHISFPNLHILKVGNIEKHSDIWFKIKTIKLTNYLRIRKSTVHMVSKVLMAASWQSPHGLRVKLEEIISRQSGPSSLTWVSYHQPHHIAGGVGCVAFQQWGHLGWGKWQMGEG